MPTKRQRRKRRRRQSSTGPAPVPAPAPAAAPRKRSADDRPAAPWGSFPLTEIVIFIGVILLVVGFFIPPPQGFVMIAVGLGLASLAGLELSIREHFGGYRSHTFLLSGAVGVGILAGLFFLTPDLWFPIALAIAAAAFAATAWMLTRAFQRRSGRPFKLR